MTSAAVDTHPTAEAMDSDGSAADEVIDINCRHHSAGQRFDLLAEDGAFATFGVAAGHSLARREFTVRVPVRYRPIRIIGFGAQGVVMCAWDFHEERHVVIKRMLQPFVHPLTAKQTYREFKLLSVVNHQNIVRLLDVFSPNSTLADFSELYLVMEHMDYNLLQLIERPRDHRRLAFILYQMLCGLHHLHKSGIVHRDLKPANIAVNEQCQVKLLDFGLARGNVKDTQQTQYVTTRPYRAPEVIVASRYSDKMDVWSIGCMFAELILRRAPVFGIGQDSRDQLLKVFAAVGSPPEEYTQKLERSTQGYLRRLPHFPPLDWDAFFPDCIFPAAEGGTLTAANARDLLKRMLVIDPDVRISAADALKHPYLSSMYEQGEVEGPPANHQDENLESAEHSIGEWKELVFNAMRAYERERKLEEIVWDI